MCTVCKRAVGATTVCELFLSELQGPTRTHVGTGTKDWCSAGPDHQRDFAPCVVVRGPISGARGAGEATQNQDNIFRKCPLQFRARGAFTTRELATSALKLCKAAPCDYRRGSQYFRVTRGVPPFPISSSSMACLILQLAVHWVMTVHAVLRPLEH